MGKQYIVPIANDTHPDPTIPGEALDDALLNAGPYVDNRYFDHKNVTPRYEFGFGLSYPKFNFSDIKVHTVETPAEQLPPPPGWNSTYSCNSTVNSEEVLFPDDKVEWIPDHLYPYNNSVYDVEGHAETLEYPKDYSSEQQASSSLAGCASGGNPFLQTYNVLASVEEIGEGAGREVAQLYIAYPQSEKSSITPPSKPITTL